MRIWDIEPERLCRNHLLGEHRELHALWVIITQGRKGYSHHPETLRWKGKFRALYSRHEELVREMKKRGYNHMSPIKPPAAKGGKKQNEYLHSYEEQVNILKNKKCGCRV